MSYNSIIVPEHITRPVFHCVSHMLRYNPPFSDLDKAQFEKYMRLYEHFCGLRVLAHSMPGDHFHILVEVPRRPDRLPTDEELAELVRVTYGGEMADDLLMRLENWRILSDVEAIAGERERWFRRMWNLPHFMKTLKQRFSQWFNPRQEEKRRGTLWQSQYRHALVEDDEALQATTMLIEERLPANMSHFPKDFRWCTCAHAQSTGSTSLIRVKTNDALMLSGGSPVSRLTTSLYSLT